LGLLIGWALSTGGHPAWIWAYLVWVALVLAGIEALGSNGFDNVWIPWAAACLLHSVHKLDAGSVAGLWLALGLGIVFARFTIRKKALSLNGAVMAVLVGLWVMRFAGPLMLVPLFFFLGSSTLLGRLVRQADAADAKHGKARDYWQVICNGGIYAGLATLMGTNAFNDETYDGIVAMAMMVSLAISTADTWASEIGMYYKGVTWDILRRRPLPPGVSGGVSFEGNVGGAVGAGCMAAMYCLGIAFKTWTIAPYFDLMFMLPAFGVIMVVGVMGMQLDSLLGAGLQARYRDPVTGNLADTPAPDRELVSGFRWMTNDAVNLISNLVVTLVFLVLLLSLVPFHMD
jgi:uncharacterized protein (TIGR00297 family)